MTNNKLINALAGRIVQPVKTPNNHLNCCDIIYSQDYDGHKVIGGVKN